MFALDYMVHQESGNVLRKAPILGRQANDTSIEKASVHLPLMDTSNGTAPVIARSYRRLLMRKRRTYALSLLLIAILQGMTFYAMSIVAAAYTKFAVFALVRSGFEVREEAARFLSMSFPIAIVASAPPRTLDLSLYIAVSIAIIAAFHFQRHPVPIRYIMVAAALILIASAIQLLLMGRPSFESSDFSSIWLRTSLLTWMLSPALLGAVSFLFPFRLRDRAQLLLLVIACDFVFSIARYAVVLAILSIFGPVLLPLLFIFAGPLLDTIVCVCIFSWSLVSLSLRLAQSPESWQ